MGESLLLSAKHFQLKFKSPFGIAHGTRMHTDALFVCASFMGMHGYGEAAAPPYLGFDIPELATKFHDYFPSEMNGSEAIRSTMVKVSQSGNAIPKPLRTSVDIAMYDLFAKLSNKPMRSVFNISDDRKVKCSYTLGISSVEDMMEKIDASSDFTLFKIKLGGENDWERIEAFINYSSANFCVDVNQAWNSVEYSVQSIHRLKEMGCLFVEQPMPVAMEKDFAELFKKSSLPIILDESVQGLNELELLSSVCHGINVKLMKCGGIDAAQLLVRQANKLRLKVLVGCMSESTCGAMAAAQLSPWAEWVDLDGPRLINNDPFEGAIYKDGSLLLSDLSGSGAVLKDAQFFSV